MVGLGTQDDLEQAEEFARTFGITFPMFWDETFATWIQLGIAAQPAAILFAADGTPLAGWQGAIPEADVLRLVWA